MKKLINFARLLYEHNFIRHLFVGGTTFCMDIGLLLLLHGVFNVNLQLATTISYWTSIIYNFGLNRWWTFSASENKKLHQHAAAYGIILAINYLFALLLVTLLSHVMYFGLAKALAVILQISWTYPIYRKYISNSNEE